MKKTERKVPFSLKIDPAVLRRLRASARKRGATPSAVAADLLARHVR